jgi:signal transduction histidine kinase
LRNARDGKTPPRRPRRRAPAGPSAEAEAREQIALGDRALSQGREAEAEAAYRRAVEACPECGDAHQRLAVALYKRGDFPDAREAAERATDLSPEAAEAWFILGLILKDSRDYSGALGALDRVLAVQPDHLAALHYRGRTLYQAGVVEQALHSLQRAAELSPDDPNIAHDTAVAHVACRNWHEAEEWFERCIGLEPGNAETYYELGQAHEQDVTTPDADAEAAYLQAVALSPQHLPALFRLTVLWARRRRTDSEARAQALETLSQMTRRDDLVALLPDAHLAYYLLGAVLDDDPVRAEEAAAAYRKCLALRPSFAPAHNNLGVILMGGGDLVGAAEHFRQAAVCDPHYDSAFHNLCRIWYDQPDELALEQIAEIVDAAPGEAPDILARMMGHLVDAAKSDAYASSYDRIHEVKNLIATLGVRLRKALGSLDPKEAGEITDLHGRAFEAIRGYLSAIQPAEGSRETLDVGELVEKAIRGLSAMKPTGVNVERSIEPGLPVLSGDRRRLTQLVQNLVVNAFDAMPKGGRLRVRAESFGPEGAAPGGTVRRGIRVTVEDSGRGMTEEERRRAFAPGYTTKESGSGYGLAIAAQVAREHGGSLSLEERREGGTRAVVELPERPQPETAAERLRLRPIIFEDWYRLVPSELDPIRPTDGSPGRVG